MLPKKIKSARETGSNSLVPTKGSNQTNLVYSKCLLQMHWFHKTELIRACLDLQIPTRKWYFINMRLPKSWNYDSAKPKEKFDVHMYI